MSISVTTAANEITQRRLIEFRSRRRFLMASRGWASTAIVFVVALVLAMLVDGFTTSALARWMASAVVYLAPLLTWYVAGWRPQHTANSLVDDARRMEAVDPRLHEQLVSAIELAQAKDAGYDSPEFKHQLQQQVASLMATTNVAQLLPFQLIRCRLFWAAGLCLLFLCTGLLPGLHWWNRVSRALLPGANLDRVTNVAIEIIEPRPHSCTVARSDMVGITARLNGRIPEQVLIETRAADGKQASAVIPNVPMPNMPMPSVAGNGVSISGAAANSGVNSTELVDSSMGRSTADFHGMISTDQAWIEYRVVAGQASTAWHRLTTQPRPQITRFFVQLSPPEYTRLPVHEFITDSGDLQSLRGTGVQLSIEVDQSLDSAQLQWQPPSNTQGSAKAEPITSEKLMLVLNRDTGRYEARFNIEQDLAYRLEIKAAQTGFTNAFSPTYHVHSLADEPPKVDWLTPKRGSAINGTSPGRSMAIEHIVTPESVVAMEVGVEDELPCQELWQWVRKNGSDAWEKWQQIPLDGDGSTISPDALAGNRSSSRAAWSGDLLGFKLQVGDTLETKVVATDRLGQTSESEVLTLLISADTIAIEPSEAEQTRQMLAVELESMAQRMKQIVGEKGDQQMDSSSPTFSATSEELQRRIPELLEMVELTLAQSQGTAQLQSLESVGQLLLHMRDRLAIASQLKELDNNQTGSTKAVQEMVRGLNQSSQTAAQLTRNLVSHDVLKRMSVQLEKLAVVVETAAISPAAEELTQEKRQRQLAIVLRQMQEMQQSLLDSLPTLRQDTKQRFRQAAEHLSNLTTQLAAQEQAEGSALDKVAKQIHRSILEMTQPQWLDGGLVDAIMQSHRQLANQSGRPSDLAHKVVGAFEAAVKDPTKIEAFSEATESVTANLKGRRELIRARRDGDRAFASDLGDAARALKGIVGHTSLANQDKHAQLKSTAAAIDVLQAAHGLQEAHALVSSLLREQRWSLENLTTRTDHPIAFDQLGERLERSVAQLRAAKVPGEIVERVERLRWAEAMQAAAQKINSRRWEKGTPVSAAVELSQLSDSLIDIQRALEPTVSAARSQLKEHTTSLSELAKRAATSTRALQRHTLDLAGLVQQRPPLPKERLAESYAKAQRQQGSPMSDLRDALVDHADAQNLLDRSELVSAQEADAALSVVDQIRERLDKVMADSLAAEEADSQLTALGDAANTQADAAQAFDELAEHLQRSADESLDDSKVVAPELMELARELGGQAEQQRRYEQAERLARLAAAQPQEVLRQLEEQLQHNQSMQMEMSQIAREAAQQALNRLDRAGDQQQRMLPKMEASDPKFLATKRLLLQDLQTTREAIFQALGVLVSEAKWTAGAGKLETTQRQIEQTENKIREMVSRSEAASMDRTFDDMREIAQQLADALANANAELALEADKLHQAKDQKVHQNDADLTNRRREMQDRQRRILQQDKLTLQQAERQHAQFLRQIENEARQAAQREGSLRQHLDKANAQLAQNPDHAEFQQRQQEAQRNLAAGTLQRLAADELQQQANQRVEAARALRDAATQVQPAELRGDNPSAQLSAALSQWAAERSAQLAQRLKDWVVEDAVQLPMPSNQQMLQSVQEQQAVSQAIDDSSNDLARAARHEARLNNQPTNEQLTTQAAQTKALNAAEVQAAGQSLESALASSQTNTAAPGQADQATTTEAFQRLQQSEAAIRNQADSVRQLLANSALRSAPKPTRQANQVRGQDQAGQQILDPRQMAQLLDELDRQLNLGPKELPDSSTPSNADKSRPALPSTLAAAAQQLSSQLSQSRYEANQQTTDQGMATESQSNSNSKAEPQSPVAVKLLDVNRRGDDWGKLREQSATGIQESQRESLVPAYREQIEAYFRAMAERRK